MHRESTVAQGSRAWGWKGRVVLLALLAIGLAVIARGSPVDAGSGELYWFESDRFPVTNYEMHFTAYGYQDATRESSLVIYLTRAAKTARGVDDRHYQQHSFRFSLPAGSAKIAADLRSMSIDTGDALGEYGSIEVSATKQPRAKKTQQACGVVRTQTTVKTTGSVTFNTKTKSLGQITLSDPTGVAWTETDGSCDCLDLPRLAVFGQKTLPGGNSLHLSVVHINRPAGSTPKQQQGSPDEGHYMYLSWEEPISRTLPAQIAHQAYNYTADVKGPDSLDSVTITAPNGPGVMVSGSALFVPDEPGEKERTSCLGFTERTGALKTTSGVGHASIVAKFDFGGRKVFTTAKSPLFQRVRAYRSYPLTD